MIRPLAVAVLVASPAAAELAPDVAAAVDICTAEGPTLQARVNMLDAAGWRFPDTSETAEVALAFAPGLMLALREIHEDQSLDDRLAALTRAADVIARDIDRAMPNGLFFVSDSGAFLALSNRVPDEVDCRLAAAVTIADLAAHTGLDPDTTTTPIAVTTRLAAPGTSALRIHHETFVPGLFGATDPLPIITTPSASISD